MKVNNKKYKIWLMGYENFKNHILYDTDVSNLESAFTTEFIDNKNNRLDNNENNSKTTLSYFTST